MSRDWNKKQNIFRLMLRAALLPRAGGFRARF